MTRLWRSLLLGLTLWLSCAATALSEPEAPSAPHQIMVLLRMPTAHQRPGGSYSGAWADGLSHSGRLRIAEQLAREHGLTLDEAWPMPIVGVECFVMTVPANRSPDAEMASLARDARVDSVEPINLYRALAASAPPLRAAGPSNLGRSAPAHNDPLFRTQPAARDWRLADLHEIATGRHVRVAVIDSTVDIRHPDLAGQVLVSRNFVTGGGETPEQHGTGVAGVIAALADNRQGIAGVAPRAQLMALRACRQTPAATDGAFDTFCDSLSLAKALEFAITHDAQVINLSLSGPPDPLLGRLLDAALVRGVTVVGAFDPGLPGGGFPASHAGVVAVSDETSGSRPRGIYVAPGRNIPTTQPQGRWFLVNGSSYSAAHVSGLFALMREQRSSARGAAALVGIRGAAGLIDACASVLQAVGNRECACAHSVETLAALGLDNGRPGLPGRAGPGPDRR